MRSYCNSPPDRRFFVVSGLQAGQWSEKRCGGLAVSQAACVASVRAIRSAWLRSTPRRLDREHRPGAFLVSCQRRCSWIKAAASGLGQIVGEEGAGGCQGELGQRPRSGSCQCHLWRPVNHFSTYTINLTVHPICVAVGRIHQRTSCARYPSTCQTRSSCAE